MSAISQYAYYVHYHAANAIKNAPIKSDTYFSQYALLKLRSPSISGTSGISRQTKQELAKTIEGIHNPKTLQSPDLQQTWNEIKALLAMEWKDIWQSARLDEKSGRVISTGQGIFKTTFHTTYIPESKVQFYKDTLQELLNHLDSAPNLKDQYDKIYQQSQAILNEFTNLTFKKANHNAAANSVVEWTDKRLKQGCSYAKASSSLILQLRELNQLLETFPVYFRANTLATGLAEEAIVAIAANKVAGISVQHLADTLYNSIQSSKTNGLAANAGYVALTGGFSPNIEWNLQGLPADVWADQIQANSYLSTNQNGVQIIVDGKTSQQKIDVMATLPIDSNLGLKTVPISVKNRAFNAAIEKGIHLVSDTNVRYLMQDERGEFLRRYFNVLADHDEQEAIFQRDMKELNAIAELDAYKNDAKLATQLLSAYKALSGATFGRSKAELFVVYDSSGYKCYVLDIGDLIKALLVRINKNPADISRYFIDNVYSALSKPLKNTYQRTPDIRMRELLSDAQARKIDIALQINGFKTLANDIDAWI